MADDFYVEEREPVISGVPASLASDLIRRRPRPTAACYFHKQPPAVAKLNQQAVAAVEGSCERSPLSGNESINFGKSFMPLWRCFETPGMVYSSF